MSTISPTEQDLHAYLDGELSPERVAAVEEYLGHNPAEAQRLRQDAALGQPPNVGDTPIIQEKKQGWFSSLFSWL